MKWTRGYACLISWLQSNINCYDCYSQLYNTLKTRCSPRVWDNWVMKYCFRSLIGEARWPILRQYLSTEWPSLSAWDLRLSPTVTINVTQSSMFLIPPSLACTDISQEPTALITAYRADGCHRLLQKLVTYVPDCMASHTRRPYPTYSPSSLNANQLQATLLSLVHIPVLH